MGTIEIVLLLRQETLKEASKIKEYYRMQMKTKRRNFSVQNFFKNLNIYIAKKSDTYYSTGKNDKCYRTRNMLHTASRYIIHASI